MSEPFRLSISHLSLIIDILVETNFDETKWPDLGLSLNILQPQLNAIKESCRNKPHECLLDCLSSWLKSGNAFPHLLENAIKSIEPVTAERIHKILVVPASQLLLRHSSKLTFIILPIELLALLRTEGVVSKKIQFDKIQGGILLVGEPLRAVCVTVAEDHEKLRALADVFLKFEITASIGQEIFEDYSNIYLTSVQNNDDSTQDSTQPQLQEKEIRVNRAAHECSFEAMRGKFCVFLEKMRSILSEKTKLEELKRFLERFDPELKSQLQRTRSFNGLLKIIEKKCNIVNVAAIETIANRYDLADGISLVSKYKEEIEKFSNEMKLAFTLNRKISLASSSSLTCEKIEFLLDWEPSDHLLEDIRLLLERAFDDLANEVVVQTIQKANSILIICYAPLYLMNALFLEAQANLPTLLKEFDLIQLTIGHYTLYDRNKEREMKSLEEKLQFSMKEVKRIESLEQSLKEKIEHIKSLQIPATESELKNELQVSKKQLSALRLENEQSITSFKVKRDELQEEISLLTAQSLKLQENDKIQQEKLKQFEVLLKELEDSKAALEISLAESKKSAQTKVLAEHDEVLKTDKQIVFNKQVPHVKDVVDLLQRFGFPETKSEELGMALDIDPKYFDEMNLKSLTGCVIQWTRNSETKPSFVSLSRALRSINETVIADKLDQEISVERTPDLVLAAFDYHFEVLLTSLSDPKAVTKIPYGDGIIKAEVLSQMGIKDLDTGCFELLCAIRESIKINYNVIEIFANVLSKFPEIEQFGKALLKNIGAIIKVEAKEDEYLPHQKSSSSVEIMVPHSIITDISSVRIAYGKMMYNVGKVLKSSIEDFEALQDFIGSCNSDLKNDPQFHDPSQLMHVIEKGCSLINTSLVCAVAEEFQVSEVQKYIDEYNRIFTKFCKLLSELLSLKEKVADSNCQTITYVLDRALDSTTMKDIKDILSISSYGKIVLIHYYN